MRGWLSGLVFYRFFRTNKRLRRMVYAIVIIVLMLGAYLASESTLQSSRSQSIAISNMAVSFPIWSAVFVAGDGSSRLVFQNVVTGEHWDMRNEGTVYTGINSANQNGEFLIVARKGSSSELINYHSSMRSSRFLFEINAKLFRPFQIGKNSCALSPKTETEKGNYNFDVVCAGKILPMGNHIPYADYVISSEKLAFILSHLSSKGKAIIFDYEDDFSYNIFDVSAPYYNPFLRKSDIYALSAYRPPIFRNLLTGEDGIEPASISPIFQELSLSFQDKIAFVSDEAAITASPNNAGAIVVSYWQFGEGLVAKYTHPVE